ncbi:MAG: hypothetical protein HYV07_23965 [Deltaproteobacteria bacterium]|nr:hypothetical protein [Deltaproteobacteria bacterium]
MSVAAFSELARGLVRLTKLDDDDTAPELAVWLARSIGSLTGTYGEVRVDAVGGQLSLNGESGAELGTVASDLIEILERANLSSLAFVRAPDPLDLVELRWIARRERRGREGVATSIRSFRTTLSLDAVERAEARRELLRAYSNVLVTHATLRERAAAEELALVSPLRKAVHAFLRAARGQPFELSALAAYPRTSDPSAAGGAAMAIAVALFQQLAAPRELISEIAMAALVYDLRPRPAQVDPKLARDEARSKLLRSVIATANADGDVRAVRRAALRFETALTGGLSPGIAPTSRGRILEVAIAFAELLAPVASQRGLTPNDAIAALSSAGAAFDPRAVRLLADTVGVPPAGSMVRLSNGELAVVVGHRRVIETVPIVVTVSRGRIGRRVELAGTELVIDECLDPREHELNPTSVVFEQP